MGKRQIITAIICVSALLATANADQIQLKNGDSVSGTITKISGGKIVFNALNIGQITVDAAKVKSISGDKIIFANGDTLTGTVEQLDGGQITLQSAALGELTVDMAQIASFGADAVVAAPAEGDAVAAIAEATAPAEAAAAEEEAKPDKTDWDGSISAGVTSMHGNTVRDSYNFSANMVRRSTDDRWTLGADFAKSRQKDPTTGDKVVTENWWRTNAKYDYFLSEKWYLYGEGRYEKDAIARLDRRVVLGGGFGYQWIETDKTNFRTEGGIASVYERFDDATDSDSKLSAQLGYHFDTKLRENIMFVNDLTYYPSFEQVSDYFLTTTAEVRAMLTKQFFANFKVIFDYDTSPATTAQSTDVKYIFGLGYEF